MLAGSHKAERRQCDVASIAAPAPSMWSRKIRHSQLPAVRCRMVPSRQWPAGCYFLPSPMRLKPLYRHWRIFSVNVHKSAQIFFTDAEYSVGKLRAIYGHRQKAVRDAIDTPALGLVGGALRSAHSTPFGQVRVTLWPGQNRIPFPLAKTTL